MAAQPIKALLSLYDEAYHRKFGVAAPIVAGKDADLAKRLLGRYSLEQLTPWVRTFFEMRDPFIQSSGYTFGVFAACIGKVIAVAVPSVRPIPPAPVIELARSIARANAEHAEQERADLRQREQELMAHGMSEANAKFTAGREWIRKQ